MIAELTAAAEADLEAIGAYIARDNPVVAAIFVRELYRCCFDIADMPEAWQVVPCYDHHGIRCHLRGRCLTFYRVGPERISILHVLNGAMEVEAILFPDG